jgi:DnaA family protein
MAQLPLALGLHRQASFESLVGAANRPAVEHVRAVALGERADSVWLAGPSHTGKSHLLAAACHTAGAAGLRPMYIALRPDLDPDALAELESVDLLALDDLDTVAGHARFESRLFPVIDGRLQGGGLLLAARQTPRDCGFSLPDLASRVAAAAVYRLAVLGDEELTEAVAVHAAMRGLRLDAAAAAYLLHRVSRDLAALTGWLERIDRFALATQRQVTIPLLRQVLEAES